MTEEEYNILYYQNKRRKRRRKIIRRRFLSLFLSLLIIIGVIFSAVKIYKSITSGREIKTEINPTKNYDDIIVPDWIDKQYIHIHTTARSGKKLNKVNAIVIHYVGNPHSSAQNNRDFFDKDDTEVSSHFVVGLNGEIIQCVPLSERSAASNNRNKDTISIENCHPDATGKFNDDTYNSLVKLTAWLCHEFDLTEKDVIRHYDITGKICPKYFVENEDKWDEFKENVGKKLKDYSESK